MCGAHYCRPLLGVLDSCTLVGIAPTSTPEMTLPVTSRGPFLVFLASFCYLSRSTSGFTATTMEHCFVTHSIASRQIGSSWNLNKFLPKKMLFSFVQPKKPVSVSTNCGPFFENDQNRGQPLAKISTGQTIWHVCRVLRFLGYLVQK